MSVVNELKLSFPSKSCNERIARMCIAAFISDADPTIGELTEIKTAVSEAVTNSIVHGYRGIIGTVNIHARFWDNGLLTVKISDKGCGIPDVEKAMEPLYTSVPEEERSGLGFSVMESFTDKLKVRSVVGKGTTVTLQRRIGVHNDNDKE